MRTPEPPIDQPNETDWQEWFELVEHHCWYCDGLVSYDSYDDVDNEVIAYCPRCMDFARISTEPDPDTAYDRD